MKNNVADKLRRYIKPGRALSPTKRTSDIKSDATERRGLCNQPSAIRNNKLSAISNNKLSAISRQQSALRGQKRPVIHHRLIAENWPLMAES